MTETGRDVRQEFEYVRTTYGLERAVAMLIERVGAVRAVVEAAQEVDGFYEAFRTTGDLDIEMLDALYQVRLKLAALHSQASDERKG